MNQITNIIGNSQEQTRRVWANPKGNSGEFLRGKYPSLNNSRQPYVSRGKRSFDWGFGRSVAGRVSSKISARSKSL